MSLLKERWKSIPEFEGSYIISNYGRVKSLKRICNTHTGTRTVPEKILKLGRSKYLTVGLGRGKKKSTKTFPVHKLVALLFVKNPNGYSFINHDDADKYNNFYKNLKWCTAKQNTAHAIKKRLMVSQPGEANGMASLTEKDVLHIRKLFEDGMQNMHIAAKFNISRGHVTTIVKRRRWTHI